jgi:hypothetical protein
MVRLNRELVCCRGINSPTLIPITQLLAKFSFVSGSVAASQKKHNAMMSQLQVARTFVYNPSFTKICIYYS